ncbi:MAG: hypothetical protein ACLP9L_02345 [Thermoguttaceae bacterium]
MTCIGVFVSENFEEPEGVYGNYRTNVRIEDMGICDDVVIDLFPAADEGESTSEKPALTLLLDIDDAKQLAAEILGLIIRAELEQKESTGTTVRHGSLD